MRFGSLFSGIGGIDLGLERSGMECVWQVEIDEYCRRVLEKHWPDVRRHGDVRECGVHNLETVDLIAGGFPCQPHSVAGKRKGAADDRNLWPEFKRVIAELKPQLVLAENVPNIKNTYLDTVLSDLESQGYACATLNIPAVAFDAPHRRERIFIVAYSSIGSDGGEILSEEIDRAKTKRSAGRIGRSSHVAQPERAVRGRGTATREGDEQGRQSPETKRTSLQPRHRQAYSGVTQSGGEVMADTDRARQQEHCRTESMGEEFRSIECGSSSEDAFRDPISGRCGGQPRRRTRKKLEDRCWWTVEPDVGRVAHGIPSRVDRLRGLGNAVVPQVAEWIGERILFFDKEIKV